MIFFQSYSDIEGILSIKEVSMYGLLISVIIYLFIENKNLKKETKEQRLAHMEDIKKYAESERQTSKDYYTVISSLKK
mgnify:FL=1|tara:strand:+ start:211 stop:444 length:234 start_codon:yes stop_codon:yes gene_type:complete